MKIEFQGTDSVNENINEKLKSPFWGSMVVTWLTWNWKVWYVTFFISHDNLGINGNKIDYIKELYNWINLSNAIFSDNFLTVIESYNLQNLFIYSGLLFHWILMPLFLSWLIIIFVTPKISHWFLEKHDENKIKENEKLASRIKSQTKVLKAEKDNIVEKQKIEKITEKSEEEKWDEEYKILRTKYPDFIDYSQELMYDMYGYTDFLNDYGQIVKKFNSEYELILDVNEIIQQSTNSQKDTGRGGNFYQLTEKGKYFLKKSSLEKIKKEDS